MDIIFNAANVFINDANKGEELREWFKSLTAYVCKVCRSLLSTLASVFTNRLLLLQAAYVLEPDYNNDNLFSVGD
jgi:hypothetical protein